MAAAAKTKKKSAVVDGRKIVAQNRRARHDYEILDEFEAGMSLLGSEVKSLREGKCQLKDSYVRYENGEMWLIGVHIPPYLYSNGFGAHAPERARKLLLHRREIEELKERSQQEALTIVPLSVFFDKGIAKVQIALARGRRTYDKRRHLAEQDAKREAERGFRDRSR
jgi:SsrA-binding protein